MCQQTVSRVATHRSFFTLFQTQQFFCFYPQKQKDKGIEVDTRVREKVLFVFFAIKIKIGVKLFLKVLYPFLNFFSHSSFFTPGFKVILVK